MKDMQTEQHLCWSGMTDTEYTTSGSLEEEQCKFTTNVRMWNQLN